MPLFSVLIPAYNNGKTIERTLRSVYKQDYKEIEVIVIDDASTDDTWDRIFTFKEKHPDNDRISLRLLRNEKNLGMAGNWNACLKEAKGEFIKLLCADDLIRQDCLKKEAEVLTKNKDALMVSSDTVFIDEKGKKKGVYKRYFKRGLTEGRKAVLFSLFTRDYLGAPLANSFRKETLKRTGYFDPAFSYIIDYDFFMRIYESGKVYILHEGLNYFRIRNDSNTGEVLSGGGSGAYIKEHKCLLNKHKEILNLNKAKILISVFIRRLSIILGGIYLRLSLEREKKRFEAC